jgi:hypothetical protein
MVGNLAGCCARAASGHATAAPPSSVMNSRRLMGPLNRAAKPYHVLGPKTALCITAKLISE